MKKYLMLLLLVCLLSCSRAYAEEIGEPSGLSVQIYEHMDAGSGVIANVIQGNTFTILATDSDANGETWCYIRTDFGVEGYARAAEVRNKADDVNEEPNQDGEEPTMQNIRTINTVNVRELPSTETEVLGKIPKDTVLRPLQIQENEEGEQWYQIEYAGVVGYIRESAVRTTDQTQDPQDNEVQDDPGQGDAEDVAAEDRPQEVPNEVHDEENDEVEQHVENDMELPKETEEQQVQAEVPEQAPQVSAEKKTSAIGAEPKYKETTRRWANPIDLVVIILFVGILLSGFASIRMFQVIRIVQRRRR